MGRAASTKNIERAVAALAADADAIGARLGVSVYQCNVPADAIAALLHVSLPTVYRWFYGTNDVDPPYRKKVIRLTAILTLALETGSLPAEGSKDDRTQALIAAIRDVVEKAKAQV